MGPSAISARNPSMSARLYSVGRHIRGDWLKTWIASQPISTPRSWALARPPAVDTWPPISIGSRRAETCGQALYIRPARVAGIAQKLPSGCRLEENQDGTHLSTDGRGTS